MAFRNRVLYVSPRQELEPKAISPCADLVGIENGRRHRVVRKHDGDHIPTIFREPEDVERRAEDSVPVIRLLDDLHWCSPQSG